MKVAVVGAGSTYTPELVSGLGRECEAIDVARSVDTALAGFDLGSKLSAISALTASVNTNPGTISSPASVPLAGISSLTGYRGLGPAEVGISYGDPNAGVFGAFINKYAPMHAIATPITKEPNPPGVPPQVRRQTLNGLKALNEIKGALAASPDQRAPELLRRVDQLLEAAFRSGRFAQL